MDKANFKVVYNLVKDYDSKQFEQLINSLDKNEDLKKVIEINGIDKTVSMLNKINNLFNNDLETSEEEIDVEVSNQLNKETSVLDTNEILTTDALSETSLTQIGGTETTLDSPINHNVIQSILDEI